MKFCLFALMLLHSHLTFCHPMIGLQYKSLKLCNFGTFFPIHFNYMKKSSSDILQNSSFCVSQKKEHHIGLE